MLQFQLLSLSKSEPLGDTDQIPPSLIKVSLAASQALRHHTPARGSSLALMQGAGTLTSATFLPQSHMSISNDVYNLCPEGCPIGACCG